MNKKELKNKYKTEKVLVVPNDKLEECYSKAPDKILALVDAIAEYGSYDYRYNAELDFDLKQVIPYIVLTYKDKIFATERLQGDERLVGRISIGVGGHVNPVDSERWNVNTVDGAQNTIIDCIIRELSEETTVDLTNGFKCQYLTVFTDDREDVSKVHVCFLTHIELENDDIDIKETEKLKGRWMTVEEVEQCQNIEGWSEIALKFIKDVI